MDNLRSWQKGQSGNPKGRPKGSRNWNTIVKDLLHDETLLEHFKDKELLSATPLNNSKNAAEAIVATLILKALNGDIKAAEWLRKASESYATALESSSTPILVGLRDNPESKVDSYTETNDHKL